MGRHAAVLLCFLLVGPSACLNKNFLKIHQEQYKEQRLAWWNCVKDYTLRLRAEGRGYNSSFNLATTVCEPQRRVYQAPLIPLVGYSWAEELSKIDEIHMREELIRRMIDAATKGK